MSRGWEDYAAFGIPGFVFVALLLGAFARIDMKSIEAAVKILAALLTPLIAAIAVYIALQQRRIAQQQARTAERKLRLETFDKRYKVFEALLEFISTVLGKVKVDQKDLYKYSQATKSAYFLFGYEIQSYLDEVYKKSLRLMAIVGTLRRNLQEEEREKWILEEQTLIQWFSEQYDAAKDQFSKHMSLDFE